MELPQRFAATSQSPTDADVVQADGETSLSQPGAEVEQSQPRMQTDDWEMLGHTLQTEFQDSNLSPALPLLPVNSRVDHMFNEYSLFQYSDSEFAPLRPYPDVSTASGRFPFPLQSRISEASDHGSLSQHPLTQETIQGEDIQNSCFSLSQHSLSSAEEGKQEEIIHFLHTATTERKGVPSRDDTGGKEKVSDPVTDPKDKPVGETAEDEAFFLNKDIPAGHLLDLLQKDIGMASGSSSVASSASEMSVKIAPSSTEESKRTQVCKPYLEQSSVRGEGPSSEASLPQHQTNTNRDLFLEQSHTLSSEVSNITMGPRSTQPDDSSERLHRELLTEAERRSCDAESEKRQKSPAQHGQSLIVNPTETSEGKLVVTGTDQPGGSWTVAISAGVEQDIWSSGNQTRIDESYLGFLPQAQSTPGVFKDPPKSSVKAKLGQLSAIDSYQESPSQSDIGISPQPADVYGIHASNQEEAASVKVQSLPSLSYVQKVDAWRANQTSGKTSLFDSSALQGFPSTSHKKDYDVVSDTRNPILSQQPRSLQPSPSSLAANQIVSQSSVVVPCGSSFRRGEAVGNAPGDKDNTGCATTPSASLLGRSQSHSPLSTVDMSIKNLHAERRTEHEKTSDRFHHRPRARAQPSPVVSLGQFRDASPVQDLTLSSSQGSHNSEAKLETGASSVISLEVDNYVPYWTSKHTTPTPQPRPGELNIEERIPLYLHNLGINQSPSTILTPFVPRGPIREAEFSPTDLCTIKGSTGTPTKSTQPSEGGSPLKGEFSRSSIPSVDSSISIPVSLDSFVPLASIQKQTGQVSPPLDTEDNQSEHRLASSSQHYEDSYLSSLQSTLQQQRNSSLTSCQNTTQPGDKFYSDLSLGTKAKDLESHLRSSPSLEENAGTSFPSSKALSEIRKLLTQTENKENLQDVLFSSSSAPEAPGTQLSQVWVTSSSHSMLSSEKLRESSVGEENMATSGQPNNPSTKPLFSATASNIRTQDSTVGSSFVFSQSARRTEPEGCSAAPPDNTGPPQPAVYMPTVADQSVLAGVTEEDKETPVEVPQQISSSTSLLEETDRGLMSDRSSDSSLAERVAKLLQKESPATIMSSTPSTTDHEESKARELTKIKISEENCGPLELDEEDRRRIEEIKKELLLRNPIKSHGSTDTVSSLSSNILVQESAQQVETLDAVRVNNNQESHELQGLSTDPSVSRLTLQNRPCPDLEAKIYEIAAKEGVTLPWSRPHALTSVTTPIYRRSTPTSPSASPPLSPTSELLPLTVEQLLHTTDEEHKALMETASVFEPSSTPYTSTSRSALAGQMRQDAIGGQLEEHSLPSLGLGRQQDSITHSFRQDGELLVQDEAEQAPASATPDPLDGSEHVSHVHLTRSPKATEYSPATLVNSSHTGAATGRPPKEFIPFTHSSSNTSSPDEGVGLSSPPEWTNSRELKRWQVPERAETSSLFKTTVTSQFCTPPQKLRATKPSAVPTLFPYKPHGSKELFYIPQTEADLSSNRSDTTMESTHPGSDDAVPPHFSSDVLGRGAHELDRGVTIRHTEGIYSKRLKAASLKMHKPEHNADRPSQTNVSRTLEPSSQVSAPITRTLLPSSQKFSEIDRGTSPEQFFTYGHPEPRRERFEPADVDVVRNHLDRTSVPQTRGERQVRMASDHLQPTALPSSSALPLQESQPTRDGDTSLLERLERLSRLIHGTKSFMSSGSHDSFQSQHLYPADRDESETLSATSGSFSTVDTARLVQVYGAQRAQHLKTNSTLKKLYSTINKQKEGREHRRGRSREPSETSDESTVTADSVSPASVYTPPPHQGPSKSLAAKRAVKQLGKSVPAGQYLLNEYGTSASRAAEPPYQGPDAFTREPLWSHRGVSKRDQATQIPLQSSTYDPPEFSRQRYRMVDKETTSHHLGRRSVTQARGEQQQQPTAQQSCPSLNQLWERFNAELRLEEARATRHREVAADSASAPSTDPLPSHRDPSRRRAARRTVKRFTTDDVEVVSNRTRRHTRDVGTTFPSAAEARTSDSSSFLPREGRGGWKSPFKSRGYQRLRESKRSPPGVTSKAVSWFISADELRSDSRKENQPEEDAPAWRPSTAWFEPYSRVKPWREPLIQRQVYEDRNRQPSFRRRAEPDVDLGTKLASPGRSHMSLQEALVTRRPEFIYDSRRRVKQLTQRVEERKLKELFRREREKQAAWPGRPGELQRPAGTVVLRRAVPRKEMIKRSKLIYDSLPEVQRKRQEERRQAEYQSFRLNARLYSKRITGHVLGRVAA